MKRIQELIRKYCPDGVPMVKLGDIMTIVRGASPRPIKDFMTSAENGTPWIKIGDVRPDDKYLEKTEEFITQKGVEKSRLLQPGDFILSNSMSFGRPYILKISGCIHDGWIAMSNFKEILSSDFLYQTLKSNSIQSYWKSKANDGGAMTNLNADIVRDTPIPLPPLPVQEEIVRILDSFTALQQNLEQELQARQKQYEYYRESLVSSCKERMLIGDTCTIITGGDIPEGLEVSDHPTDLQPYPVYGNGKDVYGYIKTYRVEHDSVCISSIGANTGDVFFWQGKFTPIIRLKVITPDKQIITPKYLYYALSCIKIGKKNGGGIPNINANDVKRLEVPVPSLAKQQEIVKTLDSFTSLIENIRQEKALRQKQYEYYREMLLNFEAV